MATPADPTLAIIDLNNVVTTLQNRVDYLEARFSQEFADIRRQYPYQSLRKTIKPNESQLTTWVDSGGILPDTTKT